MASQEERDNYFCLTLLLFRVGNQKLRQYFKKQWPIVYQRFKCGTVKPPWNDTPHDAAKMTKIERSLKFNSTDEETKFRLGNTKNWDFSLLTSVLRYSSLKFVRHSSPKSKALDALRKIRNELIAHATDAAIPNTVFHTAWTDACKALRRFNVSAADFKCVEDDVNKPWNALRPMLKQCVGQEKEIKDSVDKINSKLEQLQQGQDNIAEGQDKLLQGQDNIAEGYVKLLQGQDNIAEGQDKLLQGQDNIAEGHVKLLQGQDNIAEGHVKLLQGQDNIAEGHVKLLQGQDNIEGGQDKLLQGQDNIAEGQDKLIQGQDNIAEGQDKLLQGHDNIEEGQAKLLQGQDTMIKILGSHTKVAVLVAVAGVILYGRTHFGPRDLVISAFIGALLIYLTYWAYMICYINNCSQALKSSVKIQTESLPKIMPSHDVHSVKTDNIFTNLTVYYADKKQEKKEQAKDLDRGELLQEYTKRRMSCKVEKCEDVFIDMQGENSKLLLTGKPGIGKTFLCEKVIRDWSMNRILQYENTPNIEFAYLLKFRQLSSQGNKKMNLQELLNCSPLLDDNSVINDSLFEHLIEDPSKVLIILDGFDESSEEHRKQITGDYEENYPNDSKEKMPIPALCSKLMRGKVLRNSVVLVSSRPGKAEELGKIKFDRYVEISGFSPEQVIKYVDKYFSEPEKEQTKKAVREHIEKNENLISFCHIPLLSLLLCWCLEWRISCEGITENLPAKITDLYDDVAKVLVQKLHAILKYSEMSDYAKTIAEETLDKLAKLAANLLKKSKYIFDEKDMKKLDLTEDEIKNLKVSGILHCVPGIRNTPFETKAEFSFTHLTLQEYLSALFFVKHKEIPENVSGQTFVFMCGLLSREEDGEQLMKELIQQITPKDNNDHVNQLLFQCLDEYGKQELSTKTINNLYCNNDYILDISGSPLSSFSVGVVCRSLHNSFITTLDLTNCSLDDKCVEKITDSLVNTGITHLHLWDNNITDEGVKSICSVLKGTKITLLKLWKNNITDEGVKSICSVLKQTKITYLDLGDNNITDEGAESISRVIIQDDCQVVFLSLLDNEKITVAKKHVELVKKHKPGVEFLI